MPRGRVIASVYTQSNVLSYEPRVDRIIHQSRRQMSRLADAGEPTEVSLWMERYAFGAIDEMLHGREDGFAMVRDACDYNSWCHLMNVMSDIRASVIK